LLIWGQSKVQYGKFGDLQIKQEETMDLEIFIQTVLTLLKDSKNFYFLLYAVASSLFTQVVKKLCVNKVKVEIFGKFNLATILPFIFGLIFAVLDALFVNKVADFNFNAVYGVVIEATAIGATAMAIFRLVSSLSGQSLTALKKDEVFACIYTQMIYFGCVRDQLKDGSLSLSSFVSQVKLVKDNAKTIYTSSDTDERKKTRLAKLLTGVIGDQYVNVVLETLHQALSVAYSNK
jgi:hypothetical protein